jgi:hypothetical protein
LGAQPLPSFLLIGWPVGIAGHRARFKQKVRDRELVLPQRVVERRVAEIVRGRKVGFLQRMLPQCYRRPPAPAVESHQVTADGTWRGMAFVLTRTSDGICAANPTRWRMGSGCSGGA